MTTTVTRTVPPQRLVNLVNPIVRAALTSPLHRALDGTLLMVHITGRKSGRRYDIPVGYVDVDGRLIIVTQHPWRANVRGGADIEVTQGGRRRPARAVLDEDPTSVASTVHTVFERLGRKSAQRWSGLKTNSDRIPSLAELESAIREFNLATITITPHRP
jgi:F420H(2)-dependent quinone reductase